MITDDSLLLLCIIMLLIDFLAMFFTKGDILHPFCLFSLTMTWSVFLSLMMQNEWGLSVSAFTTIIFSTSILAFSLGSLWSDFSLSERIRDSRLLEIKKDSCSFKVPRLLVFLVLLLMSLCIFLNFKDTYDISLTFGNKEGVKGMIRTVRMATEQGLFKTPRWMSYRTIFTTVIADLSIYLFFYNIFIAKEKVRHNLSFLIPVCFYLPILILSGGRMGLMDLVVYILLVGALLYRRNMHFSQKSGMKVIIASVLAGSSFLILFLLFGMFTGKVTIGGRSPLFIIAHYGGLSAPALSSYLSSVPLETPYIGLTTLWDFYKKLKVLGFQLPESVTFLNFVQFNGIDTNVYTAMRRYIEDFGYIGMYLFMFFFGSFYTCFYLYVSRIVKNPFFITIYAMIALPLFFSINDDIFFSHIVETAMIYKILLLIIFYQIIVKINISHI